MSMSAAPIAHYLLELDAGGDASAAPASSATAAAMVQEAHASGFESGKAAAEAQIGGKLEEQELLHRNELASAREAWTRQEGGRLAEQLMKGLEELEARLADTTARILKPFLAVELQRGAIADLVESLTVLRAQDKAAVISVFGAGDLLEALRARLDGKLDNVAYHPSQTCDVRMTVGQTVLESRLGAWMARIEEAVK
jgi:hypothetical protein